MSSGGLSRQVKTAVSDSRGNQKERRDQNFELFTSRKLFPAIVGRNEGNLRHPYRHNHAAIATCFLEGLELKPALKQELAHLGDRIATALR